MSKLTIKQQRFADDYIITGNATQSAIKAGYSKKYANSNVSKLLQNTVIKAYIGKRLEEINSLKVADQREVMEFLTSVMRGEVEEPVPILDGDGTQRVAYLIPNAQARKAAAELIGKRYAMWTDKIDQTNTNIEINVGEWDDE